MYKVKQHYENCSIAARYGDGLKEYRGKLGDATSEELEGLYETGGITEKLVIIKTMPIIKKKKVRDNSKNKPLPTLKDAKEEAI